METRTESKNIIGKRNPMDPDPSKVDLYAMLTDEQLREYLDSPRTDERLRLRLMREADRRAGPRQQTAHRAAVKG